MQQANSRKGDEDAQSATTKTPSASNSLINKRKRSMKIERNTSREFRLASKPLSRGGARSVSRLKSADRTLTPKLNRTNEIKIRNLQ